MATAATSSISTAGPLPPRLMTFFARYPPKLYAAKYTGASIPLARPKKSLLPPPDALSSSETPEPPITTRTTIHSSSTSGRPLTNREAQSLYPEDQPSPFLPSFNASTSRWRAPTYSLRRQAELVKIAHEHGVEELLPPSRKSAEFKQARALELGSRIRGTGSGGQVKGHKWERKMGGKLEERRKAMEGMPEMIRKWKALGHGKGWKKYPR